MAKMTNPLDEVQFNRLTESIEWSNRQLEYTRNERIESIRQFIGFHHTVDGSPKRVIVPFLKLAVDIFVRILAPRAPRALFSADEPSLRAEAANLEIAVNMIPREIKLQKTLRRLVTEALFSFGVTKTGLYTVGNAIGYDYGQVFVDVVTLDDLIIDMAAKEMQQIQYIGNDYWLDYEEVMENKWFGKGKDGLKSDEYTTIGEQGEIRAEAIAQDEDAQLFKDKVWLRDIWIPSEGIMTTYAVTSEKRLKTFEWEGPENGPYDILGFDWVPGNLLPLAPVASWRDLHELANKLYRKLGQQADAQKTVLGFHGDDNEGVENFKKARDGDGIHYGSSEPKVLKAGGVESSTLMFFLQNRDLLSYFASNLDSLGGLSPQAETLGQDKLLSEASGAQLRSMGDQVIDFSRDLFKTLAFYELNDPIRTRQLKKQIPGLDQSIIVPWSMDNRRGEMDDFDLEIDVYSLQDNSPSLKLQKLKLLVEQFVMPLSPMIQAEGGTLSAQKILELAAKYADFPELGEIVTFMQSNLPEPAGESSMAPNTTRTYERVNRPGATDGGKSAIMQKVLAGGAQESEVAALGRSTG